MNRIDPVTSTMTLNAADAINRVRDMSARASGALPASPSNEPSFADRMRQSLDAVANAQSEASEMRRDFETGKETDLTKVMVAQQVSSLGFQLTLNVRNKALTAYKDIMNMPV